MNVGDDIPLRVGMARCWPERQVGRQALGCLQPWAFANEQYHYPGFEKFADRVEDSYPAVPHEDRSTERPLLGLRQFRHQWQQDRHLPHCSAR